MQHFNVITTTNEQSRVMGLAVVFALVLHVFLFLLLEGFFKPKAYLADQTSYQVSIVSRSDQAPLQSNSEMVEENLRDEQAQLEEPPAEDAEKFTSESAEQTLAQNSAPSSPAEPTPASLSSDQAKTKLDKSEAAPDQLTSTEFKQARVNQFETDKSRATSLESELAETKPKVPLLATDKGQTADTSKKVEEEFAKGAEQKPMPKRDSPAEQPQEEPKEQLREPQFLIGSPDNPKPVYPQRALNRGWEGDVVLGVHVDANGLVTYVEILETSNVSVLDFAAYSTVKDSWRFSPADEEERDLRGFVTVPISFRIN